MRTLLERTRHVALLLMLFGLPLNLGCGSNFFAFLSESLGVASDEAEDVSDSLDDLEDDLDDADDGDDVDDAFEEFFDSLFDD